MMKRINKPVVSTRVLLLALFGGVFLLAGQLSAQTPTSFPTSFPRFNPPPCDFSDNFYTENGFAVNNLNLPGQAGLGICGKRGRLPSCPAKSTG